MKGARLLSKQSRNANQVNCVAERLKSFDGKQDDGVDSEADGGKVVEGAVEPSGERGEVWRRMKTHDKGSSPRSFNRI